jgi:hypothetical protein
MSESAFLQTVVYSALLGIAFLIGHHAKDKHD